MTKIEAADSPAGGRRLLALDAARGLALVAMFVFHIVWDLGFFGLIPAEWPVDPGFRAYGHGIAASFIALAGIGLVLAARQKPGWRPALLRIGRIALAAAAISAVTYVIFPDEFIFFGILHLIAFAGLCALPFLRAPAFVVAGVALVALVLPLFVAAPVFDQPLFWWLGLGTDAPRSNDWRPFLPWFGVMLAGLLLGRQILSRGLPGRMDCWQPAGLFSRGLVWGGRHSLLVYLVHQPIFIAVIFVIAKMAGPQHVMGGDPFTQACEAQCVKANGQPGYCKRVCGCIVQQAQAHNLWRAVLANKLSDDERVRFTDLTRTCARFEADGGAPP